MCYDNQEVSTMENEHLDQREDVPQEETGYRPRPAWQVWIARIGLVLFILTVVLYYIHLFRGAV